MMEVPTPETRLEDLRRLTNNLHRALGAPDMVWPLDAGQEIKAFRLWKEEDVAVLRVHIEGGSAFPRHIHGQDEIVVCYRGRLGWKLHDTTIGPDISIADDLDGVLLPGDHVYFEADQPHSVIALDGDCWMIAVSVPASEAF